MPLSLRALAALAVLALAAPLAAHAQTLAAYTINLPNAQIVNGRYAETFPGSNLQGPNSSVLAMSSRSEQACERMESIDPDFPPQCVNMTTRYFCSYEISRFMTRKGVNTRVVLYNKPEAFCGVGSPSQADFTGVYNRSDPMGDQYARTIQVVRE